MKLTTLSRNLLNVVRHETEDRQLWTYLHDCPAGKWHVTDEAPVNAGRDSFGRMHVQINVKESFDDAETMLTAQRKNGFHSWKMMDTALESLINNPR
jgi:hypothetical protein